jgi:hypothetical protein
VDCDFTNGVSLLKETDLFLSSGFEDIKSEEGELTILALAIGFRVTEETISPSLDEGSGGGLEDGLDGFFPDDIRIFQSRKSKRSEFF